MRLTGREVTAIKKATKDVLGEGAQLRVFGSRTNDLAKGGDIDLIELKCETKKATKNRQESYSYRIVMRKGPTELDMRRRARDCCAHGDPHTAWVPQPSQAARRHQRKV